MGNFTFENQGTNTFLVYTIEDESPLDTLSLGMLTNNKINGFVPMVYTQLDNTRFLKYNISSKISLQQYFQGMVKKKQFLGVFASIVQAMLSMEEYMILPGSIMFDMDRIYVDVTNASAEMICLPLQSKNKEVDLGSFFKNIVFTTRFEQSEDCSYVTSIINYLNSTANFSLIEFKELIDQLQAGAEANVGTQAVSQPTGGQERANMQTAVSSAPGLGQPKTEPVQQFRSDIQPNQQQFQLNAQPNQQQFQSNVQPNQQRFQTNTQPNQQQFQKNAADTMPQMAAAMASAPKKEKKSHFKLFGRKKEEKKAAAPGNIPNMNIPGQIPGGNNYSQGQPALSNMQIPQQPAAASQPQRQVSAVPPQSVQAASQPQRQPFVVPSQPIQPPKQPSVVPPQPIQAASQPQSQASVPPVVPQQQAASAQNTQSVQAGGFKPNFGETIVLNSTAGETTVLTSNNISAGTSPYLIRSRTGEKIPVNQPVFRLGKEPNYADYCITDNSAVSRSHANLVTKDQNFYVIDTNSKNHTFLNGTMLAANKEHILLDRDKLRLADEEFEFKLI